MKTIKTTIVLAAAVLMCGAVVANPVSAKRAAAVAQNFYSALSGEKNNGTLTDRSSEWQFDGIYLFVGENGGFVLVAADDAARPILGYSVKGTLDPQNMPVQLRQWLAGYQQEIAVLRERKSETASDYASEWYSLEQGLMPKDSSDEGVEPLITTFWDQTFPYNGYCPRGTVTGCAATAQAQVMNYWKYPAFGEGSHSYTHARYGVQEADFGHTLYDWAHMPVMATHTSSDEEMMAVAKLMYHCGVGLDMMYGTAAEGGSAAAGLAGQPGVASIDNSLKDYFHYSESMQVVFKGYGMSNARWRDLLIAEIDSRRPVVYTGSGEAGGHGFICDGYDSRGYMHFNFGWSGIGDGYFPVDSISPGVGGVGGNVTYTFNRDNSALLGLVPDYALRISDTIFYIDRDGREDSLLIGVNETKSEPWTVECSADWLTLQADTFSRAGWLHLRAAENNSGDDRVAVVTIIQGNERCVARVVQGSFSTEEMCPVTVVMESTRNNGWQGNAYLSLQSEKGYVYGEARLEEGGKDSIEVLVGPHKVNTVWHTGGGTDRYVNYEVKNQYGEVLVSVEYAYRNGGTHVIEWPCSHVGIEERHEADASAVKLYPNPVVDVLTVQTEGLQKVELMEMSGRVVATSTRNTLDLRTLPAGAYFVRIVTNNTTSVKRIVKR